MKYAINALVLLLGSVLLAAASNNSWAAASCRFDTGSNSVLLTVPLSPPIISAGADIPIGTIIYQGRWTNAPTVSVFCESSVAGFLYNWAVGIEQAPLTLSGLNSGPFAGAVYQTNIPGIGVAISRQNNSAAATLGAFGYRSNDLTFDDTVGIALFGSATRYISLIKIGPLTPGSYAIAASSFPMASDNMVSSPAGEPIQGLPLQLNRVTFTGNLTVTAQTCTTPDVNVVMGAYDIREHFRSINSTTPWIDASISLQNCPTFHSFYNQTNTTTFMNFNTGSAAATTSINNSIGVRLTPTTAVKDAANGIMDIDSSLLGAASGVGIQIGWGLNNQTPTLFNFSSEQAMTLPKDGSPTIRVPLSALYIQTDTVATAGRADGKVVFTINYY
ncbi:oxidoreductase [Candidatus Symbiopectobacterium sp. 'North America']|uniref:fimbrial protein n=1 Tax=Candidatus Symbiopectobacterium sp. 'North America' TaxID=2794574 RepID=UPI0018C8F793|nr:type 1 fimbrial protein [Candidatus Symbiopectobacterium sp. 'North America']MBG6245409.1 oxidoreductase [Candidatus Symbiopectobacterium sp. 'North America']